MHRHISTTCPTFQHSSDFLVSAQCVYRLGRATWQRSERCALSSVGEVAAQAACDGASTSVGAADAATATNVICEERERAV